MSSKSSETVDVEGFELSTKSRAHKKIKVDPAKVFRGDILRPRFFSFFCYLSIFYKYNNLSFNNVYVFSQV